MASHRSASVNALRVKGNRGGAVARGDAGRSSGVASATLAAREIRHPLTAIAIYANAARRWIEAGGPNLAEALAALDRISKEVNRIDTMIDDVHIAAGGSNNSGAA